MNRLMNYDRSKVLSEQDKKPSGPLRDVEVGKISSSIKNDPIKIKQYQSDEDITGSDFGYPKNCGSPDLAVAGTVEHPVYKGWCMYNTPKGVMYFPENTKVIKTINSNWKELYESFIESPINNSSDKTMDDWFNEYGEKYGEEFESGLRNSLYDQLQRIYPNGVSQKLKINGTNYRTLLGGKISKNLNTESNKNNPFSIDWYFKYYKNDNNNIYQQPKKEVLQASGLEIWWNEASEMSEIGFKQLSSLVCGEDSIFDEWFGTEGKNVGAFKLIGIDYAYEEFWCDLLAGLMFFINPVASFSIEFAHAYDLWKNKNDKFGALISLSIGLIPLFGDIGSSVFKQLGTKIGKTSFVRVIGFITNYIKFLSGEVKPTVIWSALKNLSKEERSLVYSFYASSRELITKAGNFKKYVDDAIIKLNESGMSKPLTKKSLEAVSEILEETNFLKSTLNMGLQMGGIFTTILGASTIRALGQNPDKVAEESMESLYEALRTLEESNNKTIFELVSGTDDKPKSDEEKKNKFKEDYPCVINHPNAKEIKYNRRKNDSSVEREQEISYDIDGTIYFYDGLRKRKSEPDMRLTQYSCDSSVFRQD